MVSSVAPQMRRKLRSYLLVVPDGLEKSVPDGEVDVPLPDVPREELSPLDAPLSDLPGMSDALLPELEEASGPLVLELLFPIPDEPLL